MRDATSDATSIMCLSGGVVCSHLLLVTDTAGWLVKPPSGALSASTSSPVPLESQHLSLGKQRCWTTGIESSASSQHLSLGKQRCWTSQHLSLGKQRCWISRTCSWSRVISLSGALPWSSGLAWLRAVCPSWSSSKGASICSVVVMFAADDSWTCSCSRATSLSGALPWSSGLAWLRAIGLSWSSAKGASICSVVVMFTADSSSQRRGRSSRATACRWRAMV